MVLYNTKINLDTKNILEMQKENFSKGLEEAISLYESDFTDTEVVFFCQRVLRDFNDGISVYHNLKNEIKRARKSIFSYYETGNSSLAYQECMNIKNKYLNKK